MKHHTAFITAASVVLVLIAATAAIAANLGILSSGTAINQVGTLTVAATAPSVAPPANLRRVDDPEATTPTMPETGPIGETLVYAVGDGGTMTLVKSNSMLTITDITPSQGWQAVALREGVLVEAGFLSSDGQVLRFLAQVDASGTVQTLVDDLTPSTVGGDDNGSGTGENESNEYEGSQDDD